jgi:hypothetical protein
MEVNVRANRTNWLATSCGVNFPWIIYMDLVEDQQIQVEKYKTDVYWIELYADLFNSLFRNGKEDFEPSDYIKPYLSKNKSFAVWDTYDLLPFTKNTLSLPLVFYRFSKFNVMAQTRKLSPLWGSIMEKITKPVRDLLHRPPKHIETPFQDGVRNR